MSVVCVKFHCNVLISGKIIKEMTGSVASGTLCISGNNSHFVSTECVLFF